MQFKKHLKFRLFPLRLEEPSNCMNISSCCFNPFPFTLSHPPFSSFLPSIHSPLPCVISCLQPPNLISQLFRYLWWLILQVDKRTAATLHANSNPNPTAAEKKKSVEANKSAFDLFVAALFKWGRGDRNRVRPAAGSNSPSGPSPVGVGSPNEGNSLHVGSGRTGSGGGVGGDGNSGRDSAGSRRSVFTYFGQALAMVARSGPISVAPAPDCEQGGDDDNDEARIRAARAAWNDNGGVMLQVCLKCDRQDLLLLCCC